MWEVKKVCGSDDGGVGVGGLCTLVGTQGRAFARCGVCWESEEGRRQDEDVNRAARVIGGGVLLYVPRQSAS